MDREKFFNLASRLKDGDFTLGFSGATAAQSHTERELEYGDVHLAGKRLSLEEVIFLRNLGVSVPEARRLRLRNLDDIPTHLGPFPVKWKDEQAATTFKKTGSS